MKTIEIQHGNNWLDKLLNAWPFCLDTDSITPLLEVEYGANKETADEPDFKNWDVRIGKDCTTRSQFRNGLVYVRLLFPGGWVPLLATWCLLYLLTGWWIPIGLFLHVRWCANCARAFLQTGFGWKLNGRFAVIGRAQSDSSAAKGTRGPNLGQAQGWSEGDH